MSVQSLPCPGHAAWLGGSLIASGAAGPELWASGLVGRAQWQEEGARIYRSGALML